MQSIIKNHLIIILMLTFNLFFSCSSFSQKGTAPIQLGMCQAGFSWPIDIEQTNQKLELYDQMGVEWLRMDFSWRRMEPEQGEWDFEKYDYLVETAYKNNKKILAILVYDVSWIYEGEEKRRNIGEKELVHYLNYVKTICERYGDRLGGLEIWNEPNFNNFWEGSNQDFYELTKESVKVIWEINPDIPIAVGALSYHPVTGGKSFLKGMMEAGALEGADAVSIHPYGASINVSANRVSDLRTLLDKNGFGHEIWITEMGFPTTGWYPHKASLSQHRDKTAKALSLLTAAGASLITWYKLFDSYEPGDYGLIVPSEKSFGLIERNGTEKPGAEAYTLLANELKGRIHRPDMIEVKGPAKNQLQIIPYKGEKDTFLVLWSQNSGKTLRVQYEGTGQMTQLDYSEENILKASQQIAVTSSPVYFKIQDEDTIRFIVE